jgi:ABC-type glycerol-3-phosphate transport system substrate-binding protein
MAMFTEDKSAASPTMTGASWDGEMLANDQVAMVFGGTWIPAGLPEDVRKDIGVTPMPAAEQEGSVLYAAGWAVSAESESPEAAAEVISFLTSDEELITGHEDGIILLPPKPSALEELAASEDDPVLDVAQDSAAAGVPFGYLAPETVDSYNATLERLIAEPGSTPAEAVEQLAGELE